MHNQLHLNRQCDVCHLCLLTLSPTRRSSFVQCVVVWCRYGMPADCNRIPLANVDAGLLAQCAAQYDPVCGAGHNCDNNVSACLEVRDETRCLALEPHAWHVCACCNVDVFDATPIDALLMLTSRIPLDSDFSATGQGSQHCIFS